MNWATAITTAPRGEYYLPQAMESIAAAGWDGVDAPTIFAEPESQVFDEMASPYISRAANWHVVPANERLGSWPNFLHALETMVRWRPSADFYAVFQDDILIAENCRAWLEPQLPLEGIVSLYCSEACAEGHGGGWFQVEQGQAKRKAHGALAVIFPRLIAKLLLKVRPGKGSLTKTDIHIGGFADEREISYWMHAPSLVSHIGRRSAIQHVPGEKLPRTERAWSKFRREAEWVERVSVPAVS